jgi:methylglutaconyl-CoA hydratase
MEEELVKTTLRGDVTRVELASGEHGNALTPALTRALLSGIHRAAGMEGARLLMLGAQGRDFCLGLNLERASADSQEAVRETMRNFANCLLALCHSSLPTVALVHGRAQGGGAGLAAACDLVLADSTASFSLPEALAGLIPSIIQPVLARRMHPSRIRALALSSAPIGAHQARASGLADVIAKKELHRSADRLARRLRSASPVSLAEIRRAFERNQPRSLADDLAEGVARSVAWLERPETCQTLKNTAKGLLPVWWPPREG